MGKVVEWLLGKLRVTIRFRLPRQKRVQGVRNVAPEAEDWRAVGEELNGKR